MAPTLHQGLLDQAFHLAKKEPKKPTQASLRRSISASYYAIFHLLIDDAINRIFRHPNRDKLKYHLARTFDHYNMRKVAEQFSNKKVPRSLQNLCSVIDSNTFDEQLVFVASSFTLHQDSRHIADYDLTKTFSRGEALEYADNSQEVFNSWKQIRTTLQADIFLLGLHNQNNIKFREDMNLPRN